MLLRQGDRSEDVRLLQETLTARGFDVPTTGYFGDITTAAVRRFQTSVSLVADGIVGTRTQNALYEPVTPSSSEDTQTPATDAYGAAARIIGCSIAAIRAFAKVESNGHGFLPDGRPKILFERHVFYKRLIEQGLCPEDYMGNNGDIISTTPGGYVGGAGEYERLDRACAINRTAALESASWGAFQIMGFHWATLEYPSVAYFVGTMNDEAGQLDAFVRFLRKSPSIIQGLAAQNWAQVARAYNGPGYANNNYDTKLKAAYDALS